MPCSISPPRYPGNPEYNVGGDRAAELPIDAGVLRRSVAARNYRRGSAGARGGSITSNTSFPAVLVISSSTDVRACA